MKRLIAIILSILLLSCPDIDARAGRSTKSRQKPSAERTSATVKKEQEENKKRIELARQQLSENRRRTSRQLNALNSLNGQILKQTADIEQLSQSISTLDSLSKGISDTIRILESDVARLRGNYAGSLRRQRNARQGLSAAALVFSSESFYQAYKRLGYIRQLEKWRNNKTERLRKSVELLDLKRAGLIDLRKKHAIAVNNLNSGKRILQDKKKQAERLVASLKKENAGLEAELKDRQKRQRALDAELDRIINEEIQRAEAERRAIEKAEAERRAAEQAAAVQAGSRRQPDKSDPSGTGQPDKKTTPDGDDITKKPVESPVISRPSAAERQFKEKADAKRKLTGSFEKNKGRLLFPVAGSYNVVGTFGRSRHANLAKVEIENSGVDIETTPGTDARAVFDGTVSSIFYMDGYHNIVMVRHGEYLTVYTNLDRLAVKKGDKVKAGQKLGHIFSDGNDDNRTILHFEVRKERTKLNPLDWVK